MWSSTDLNWLKENYSGFKPKSDKILEGKISYRMLRLDGKYLVNPSLEQIQKTETPGYIYLCDTYDLRIEWEANNSIYPTAYEIGGKISGVAKKLGKNLTDMHQFPTESLCLGAVMDLGISFAKGFNLKAYVEEFLIPYLFAQTYYAKKQEWLWGDLSHGIWGLLEWLGRKNSFGEVDLKSTYESLKVFGGKEKITEVLSVRCRNHKPCPCGSGKKTRQCHPDIQSAIARLRSAISSGLINLSE